MSNIFGFFGDTLRGPTGKASMSKCMSLVVLMALLASWFLFPDRSIAELAAVFSVLLGYGLGGKMSHNKHVAKKETERT